MGHQVGIMLTIQINTFFSQRKTRVQQLLAEHLKYILFCAVNSCCLVNLWPKGRYC